MNETSIYAIENLIQAHHNYFNSQQTKDLKFRIENLKRFKSAIQKFENKIAEALWKDLHKSKEEAYLTETSIVLQEIDNHLKHLKRWVKSKRVSTPIHLLPSSSKIIYEPLGVSLIIAPWNYPFQLLMNSVVGAISSGCCAILKPSPYTPNVAGVMEELIHETFEGKYISIVQGGRDVNRILLEQRFDIIFFTGSPDLGKIVMKAAANHLTPVVLELGGKSPCIVDATANLDVAAKRIAWGKTINAGQTCIAPDYLFVHSSIKNELLKKIAANMENMFGENAQESPYFPRIVNQNAMQRLQKLLLHGDIVYGGKVDSDDRYISPTIIDEVKPDFPIMQEEIFGPLLPVMTFEKIDTVIEYVNSHEKPLAFYYFGKNKQAKDVLSKTTSGGGCVNDTLMHITNHHLPFGGVGNSGMGRYHGHDSFLAFSNARSIVTTPTWFDLPVKYVPFKYFKWVKKIL
ncbi:MAG TPA: aldehyde dehydrogenase [Paludibacter sp.]